MTIVSNIEKTIEAAERLNPELNSFLSIERDASLKRAAELDAEPGERLLEGGAIGVKDNICTKGMRSW